MTQFPTGFLLKINEQAKKTLREINLHHQINVPSDMSINDRSNNEIKQVQERPSVCHPSSIFSGLLRLGEVLDVFPTYLDTVSLLSLLLSLIIPLSLSLASL